VKSRLLAAVTLFVIAVSLCAPAHAETHRARDDVRDVEAFDDSPDGQLSVSPAPRRVNGDLTAYGVGYGKGRIRASMAFRDIDRSERVLFEVGLTYVVKQKSRTALVTVVARPGHWTGTGRLIGLLPPGRSGVDEACRIRHTIDYRANRVTLSFPAGCIGNPRAIRARVGVSVGGRGAQRLYSDVAPGPIDRDVRTEPIHRD
jgi:hypothetical protein